MEFASPLFLSGQPTLEGVSLILGHAARVIAMQPGSGRHNGPGTANSILVFDGNNGMLAFAFLFPRCLLFRLIVASHHGLFAHLVAREIIVYHLFNRLYHRPLPFLIT